MLFTEAYDDLKEEKVLLEEACDNIVKDIENFEFEEGSIESKKLLDIMHNKYDGIIKHIEDIKEKM